MGEHFWESAPVRSAAKETGGQNFENARHSNNFYELGLKNFQSRAGERRTVEANERKAELESLFDSDTDGLFADLDLENPRTDGENG